MIELARVGSVAVITLNQPEKRNALNPTDQGVLADLIRSVASSDARALILTGNGAFCAGADLKSVVRRQREAGDTLRAGVEDSAQELTRALVATPVPTLAAVDGPAVGLGFDLALACDVLLIGPEGWCMQGWGRIGAIPATGGVLLLARRSGTALWQMLADQARVRGPELEQLGVGHFVADTTAREAALAWAKRLAGMPKAVLEAYVSLSREPLRREIADHLKACAHLQVGLLSDKGLAGRVDSALASGKSHSGG